MKNSVSFHKGLSANNAPRRIQTMWQNAEIKKNANMYFLMYAWSDGGLCSCHQWKPLVERSWLWLFFSALLQILSGLPKSIPPRVLKYYTGAQVLLIINYSVFYIFSINRLHILGFPIVVEYQLICCPCISACIFVSIIMTMLLLMNPVYVYWGILYIWFKLQEQCCPRCARYMLCQPSGCMFDV